MPILDFADEFSRSLDESVMLCENRHQKQASTTRKVCAKDAPGRADSSSQLESSVGAWSVEYGYSPPNAVQKLAPNLVCYFTVRLKCLSNTS